jgi:hypothetical protein
MGVSFKRIGFQSLFGLLCLTAWSTLTAPATVAQQATKIETLPEAAERIITTNSGNYFDDITLGGQFDYFFGFGKLVSGTFPENEIAEDARLFEVFYRDVLNQQASTTPLIRTPDLNSPFNTSLLNSPDATTRVVGSELVYERVPLR